MQPSLSPGFPRSSAESFLIPQVLQPERSPFPLMLKEPWAEALGRPVTPTFPPWNIFLRRSLSSGSMHPATGTGSSLISQNMARTRKKLFQEGLGMAGGNYIAEEKSVLWARRPPALWAARWTPLASPEGTLWSGLLPCGWDQPTI